MAGTGYGNQTMIFTRLLHKAGWDVTVSSNYGISGASINYEGIRILPKGVEAWGNDILPTHYKLFEPDVVFSLMDSWIIDPDALGELPLAAWTPIDHLTVPPKAAEVLHRIPFPIAMSKHGESAMRDIGLDPFYIPHGVVTDIFKPLENRAELREKFKFPEDAFIVTMVAANKGFPSRKSFEAVLKAWKYFHKQHPEAILYMHTLPLPVHNGLDFDKAMQYYNINHGEVRFANMYDLLMGNYQWEYMVQLLNVSDFMLLPSKGEGFGIPVIEAHACGCPTIVSDFTAQAELGSAYKIPIDPIDDVIMTQQWSEQANVPPSKILAALEWAYANKDNEELRKAARQEAMRYDAGHVLMTHMLPVFNTIMAMQ